MPKVLVDLFNANLSVGAAIVILLIGALFWFLKVFFGPDITRKKALYLDTTSLSKDELRLMQERDNSIAESERIYTAETADALFRDLPDDKQDSLEQAYSLYCKVKRLSERSGGQNHLNFARNVLLKMIAWFGETRISELLRANVTVTANPSTEPNQSQSSQPQTNQTNPSHPNLRFPDWLSFNSYLWLLVLALAYPILLAVANSPVSQQISVANLTLLQFDSTEHAQGLVVRLVAEVGLIVWMLRNLVRLDDLTGKAKKRANWHLIWGAMLLAVLGWVIFKSYGELALGIGLALFFGLFFVSAVADAVADAVAGAGAGADAGADAGAVAAAVAVAIVVAIAVTIVVAIAIAVTIVVAIAVAVAGAGAEILQKTSRKRHGKLPMPQYWFVLIAVSVSLLLIGLFISVFIKELSGDLTIQLLSFLLFGLLPVCNAVVDWLSLNVTRHLTYKILMGEHRWGKALGWGLFDLVLAVFFVFVVSSTSLLGLSLVSIWAGQPVLDFNALMAGLRDPNRIGEHLWVHAMVLSTLIPTLFHFGLVIYSFALTGVTHWQRSTVFSYLAYPNIKDEEQRYGLMLYGFFRWALVALSIAAVVATLWALSLLIDEFALILWHYADWLLRLVNPFY